MVGCFKGRNGMVDVHGGRKPLNSRHPENAGGQKQEYSLASHATSDSPATRLPLFTTHSAMEFINR